ncbi:cell wall-binding repeat-containing protein [Clostridium coskatii]|uniref:N-acetylmuramoyl-L-alanine amidase LytC n=1 Tax=Clostridium coskatii TaxID=1705578 RepID=A0A166TKV9_9CLOT|nr:cell wall-binding repeat-containing protein [Clostridium coskatii]OAA93817.1 N-acetylmuramoyl-L-alanine amidase LytC precursor [Clostridium coskatii]OBR96107.1 N-acetylmuramoyl-L-alanine amidase LytC precursor [Clostridium coskatii]
MYKKGIKKLGIVMFLSFILNIAFTYNSVKAYYEPTISRISGDNRYATAAKVAVTNWTTSDNVVLVSGEEYADAVSASSLAKKLDAPILLTTSNTLSPEAEYALNLLRIKNIYVIGGNASISQNIRDTLKSKYTLTELEGSNRYETNIAVAKYLVKLGVSASNIIVASGEGFADALSVSSVAAAKGQILLLANNNKNSIQSSINFAKINCSKAVIVGTRDVISDSIKNTFGANATRVNGGANRFDTNLAVLKTFKSDLKNDNLYVANASAAIPDNLYADALVASALAGKYSAPLVLVDKDGTDATNNAMYYIKDTVSQNTHVQIIGGLSVIPDSIFDNIYFPLSI